MRAAHCSDFACCGAQAVGAHGLRCSAAREIFPNQRSNWCSLHWRAGSEPPDHQGNPWICILARIPGDTQACARLRTESVDESHKGDIWKHVVARLLGWAAFSECSSRAFSSLSFLCQFSSPGTFSPTSCLLCSGCQLASPPPQPSNCSFPSSSMSSREGGCWELIRWKGGFVRLQHCSL